MKGDRPTPPPPVQQIWLNFKQLRSPGQTPTMVVLGVDEAFCHYLVPSSTLLPWLSLFPSSFYPSSTSVTFPIFSLPFFLVSHSPHLLPISLPVFRPPIATLLPSIFPPRPVLLVLSLSIIHARHSLFTYSFYPSSSSSSHYTDRSGWNLRGLGSRTFRNISS